MNPVNLEDGRLQLASRLKDQKIALFIDDVWGRFASLAQSLHNLQVWSRSTGLFGIHQA